MPLLHAGVPFLTRAQPLLLCEMEMAVCSAGLQGTTGRFGPISTVWHAPTSHVFICCFWRVRYRFIHI